MLTPIIIRHKISVGNICQSGYHDKSRCYNKLWYIPVYVKGNILWNLLASNLDDVKAIATFIEYKNGIKKPRHYQATWLNPDIDDPTVKLHIGSIRKIRLAENFSSVLRPIGDPMNDVLTGNQDILLKLRSNGMNLGRWLFKGAIVDGLMQEVSPKKLKIKGK